MGSDAERLRQLLDLVAKEDRHLLAVRDRFRPNQGDVDPQWLQSTLATDIGIDRLESFNAKFARMQDTITDKLLPQLLRTAGETPMAAIDNLNRAERLGFISDTEEWMEMRRLRNRLVHEYIESVDDMAFVLTRAFAFTDELHSAYSAMAGYAEEHLKI